MEPQQQQQENQVAANNDQQDMSNGSGGGGGGNNKGGGTTFLCRQSSTRWTPTSDQIRILKDLYYNNGVRSPSAEQIQRISARLRQYGKIEGKNVFYWFQNHKARERQKKRFTSDNIQRPPPTSAAFLPPNHLAPPTHSITPNWKTDHQDHHMKYSNLSPVVSSGSPSSASMLGVNGQMGHYGYGAVAMEKAFRDCGTSSGSISHNFGWVGVDPYSSPYALLETRSSSIPLDPYHDQDHDQHDDPDDDHDDEELATAGHIETLPLFPMHRDEDLMMINGYGNMIKPPGFPDHAPIGGGGGGYYPAGHVSSRTSLELTLNSYRPSPDSL